MEDLENCDADIVFNPFIKEYPYEDRSETIEVPDSIDPKMWGVSLWGYSNVNFWAITYKTDILKPLQPLFAEKTMFDDFILTWAALVHGRTSLSLDYPIYHYLLGRPGQTMLFTQQRKGAISYVKCFDQYELVRSRIDTASIPSEFLDKIDLAISEYARYIFPNMVYLPLWWACDRMRHLWRHYIAALPNRSKLFRRYAMLPSVVFFYVERFRGYLNRR